jgi:hypothetical protein
VPELTWLRVVALIAFAGTYLGLAVGHSRGSGWTGGGGDHRGRRDGRGREYARVGVPLTAVTLALGWLILVRLPA